MTKLLVRNVDDAVAKALEAQANARGVSVEAEHRHILVQALSPPRKKAFAGVLSEMPDAGEDSDFERI